MRKLTWVAAAAGVVLLVAGCGSEGGGADKGGSSSGGSSAAGADSAGGSGGSDGERLTGAAVTAELTAAATGAGFAQDASGEQIPAEVKDCMVSWTADAEKAADPAKSYTDTVAALNKGGWTEERSSGQGGSVIKSLKKSSWQLQASNHSQGPLKLVMFVAVDSGPECAAAIAEENAKAKQ
ncbi:hypothetical protein [Streptomyces narbonensis]|uniref:hypothetical protein n=1 Tax=Streptomyces narbonensis TaxID=67333 RepID=UPI00167384C5|nr:hypothetical protein [Streptomyces narbonensis]GGV94049.1 hypothetical protein GCM10010230_06510 [Streptomyces narbonensis]